jgi:hypothetical protein
MKKTIIISIIILLVVTIFFVTRNNKSPNENIPENELRDFSRFELKTNTAIKSIELDEILDGGPGKDGIPSVDNPKFISIEQAKEVESSEVFGVSLTVNGESKFYPYSILNWHEIVNDEIGGRDVLVTFCPLCGSAIVFNPKIDGETREFGVSGKLWQSNLLMYDRVNESLWSQSIGEAVVGNDTGTKLEVIDSDLITFEQFAKNNPNGKVLSRDTGFTRFYNNSPYGGYENSEGLIFPIKFQNSALFEKEIMFVFNYKDNTVALKRSDLSESKNSIKLNGEIIYFSINDGIISVENSNGNNIPGYHEMWFSFATQHPENGIYWTKETGLVK